MRISDWSSDVCSSDLSPDALSLLVGAVDGVTATDVRWGIGEQFVQISSAPGAPTRKLEVTGGGENTYFLNYPAIRPAISPDGSLALISGTPREVSASWDRYEGETFQTIVREWRKSSKSFMGRQLQQLFLASVDGASARPLWNVPLDPSRSMQMRSEEHTSELQSLMRISYAVFCLKKKNDDLPWQ